jgi:hypothetical protein
MMNRPTRKFVEGQEVSSAYHDEKGTIQEIDWSITFGQWTYKLLRTQTSRYGGSEGTLVWVCESSLKEVCHAVG